MSLITKRMIDAMPLIGNFLIGCMLIWIARAQYYTGGIGVVMYSVVLLLNFWILGSSAFLLGVSYNPSLRCV